MKLREGESFDLLAPAAVVVCYRNDARITSGMKGIQSGEHHHVDELAYQFVRFAEGRARDIFLASTGCVPARFVFEGAEIVDNSFRFRITPR